FFCALPLTQLGALFAAIAGLGIAPWPADAAKVLIGSGGNPATTGVLVGGGGGVGGPPALTAPGSVRITSRVLCVGSPVPAPCSSSNGASSAQISWYDVSTDDVRTHLERRREPNGSWARVQTIEGPVTYGRKVYDRGLAPDSRYCYRLTAEASDGRAATSGTACVVTQVANDLPVTRAQLRLVVANVSGGGTDGSFTVALNERPFDLPNGNFTTINTPRDDLEAGTDVTYEMNVPGLATYRDVTRISFGSSSTDEVCIQEVQLILNGNENRGGTTDQGDVLYERFFGTTASTCRWVGGIRGPLVVDHAALRAAPEFASITGGPPILSIGKEEIEARIEPIIGTLFYERTDVEWDPDQTDAVGVSSALAGTSLRIHLDFEGEATGPNPEVDIDFYMTPVFTPTSVPTIWNFDLQVAGLTASVDFSWWAEVLSSLVAPLCTAGISIGSRDAGLYDCISSLENYIESQIEAGFEVPPSEKMTIRLPFGCIQPTVEVANDASVLFGCAAFERTTTPSTKGVISGATSSTRTLSTLR
ncbi:fibronectin type III domain-containing protein, partial [Myxococcota bacterium]|nr:fibronectin type III domain-containing protein [Myxococcota bacterium]